jgi:hypothetical protein
VNTGVAIVCREVDKNSGEIATYLCKKDAENRDLCICLIRAVSNPELRYYVIRTVDATDPERLEDILSFLKHRNLTDNAVELYGGILRL